MARKGHGRPASLVQIAGSGTTYPDDGSSPVGSNEWNANRDTTGVLGFTKKTEAIASNAINVTDSFIEVTNAGEIRTLDQVATALSTDYYPSDTSTKSFGEGDLLYLVKATAGHTITLKHQYGSSGGAGKITTLTGGDLLLDVNIPRIFMCRTISGVQEWIEYGGGTASDLDTTNFSAAALVTASDTIASNDNDTTIPTSAAVKDLIEASVSVGDITSVVAGSGLTGGATSGAATVNVIGGTGITANADDIAIDSTVTTLTGTQTLTNKTLTAPVLTTPALGTPASGVATNLTGTAANLTAGNATLAAGATALASARTIGGTSFDGTANIAVGLAATATALATARTIGGTSFDGTGNIAITTNANLTGDVTSSGNATTIATDSVDIAMLSATGTASNSTFLRGDNAWTAVSSYATPTIGSTAVPSGSTQATIAGLTLTSPVINTQITGSALLDSDSMSGTSATTVSSSESIKAYVDSSVAANITLKGTYDATNDNPSLDDGSPIAGIVAGDHYIVSVAGTFFSEVLQVGDSLIAKQDSPTTFAHWITVNSNIVTPIVRANIAGDAIDGTLIEDDAVAAEHLASDAVVNLSVASGAAIATSKLSGALTSVASHGLAASATTDTTSASNIGTGTLAAARVATLNQDTTGTAAIATTVTCADNAANETVYPTFVDGATGAQDLETDTGLNYNPSTGTLTSPIFVGALTGNAATASTVTNDAITLAKMASGTDGNIISYDTNGDPVAVATGNVGQVLTSAGSGQPPAFATVSGSFVATANADLTFGGDYDIIDLQRLSLETQDDSWDTDSDNAAIANETQLYARAIDSNNDGIFARIKKNGSSVYLQIA